MQKNKWSITAIAKIIGIIASLASIFGVSITYLDYKESNRELKITNLEIHQVDEKLQMRDIDYQDERSKLVENLIKNFEDTYVMFNVENHSNRDIEIYGFYYEIIVGNNTEIIKIPLMTYSIRDEVEIDVFLADWKAVWDIDYYSISNNSTREMYASLKDSCYDLTHLWYVNSEFPNKETRLEKYLEKVYEKQASFTCKCRIVCRDTFNNYYYSDPKEFVLKIK